MASPSLNPEKVTIVIGLNDVFPVTSILPILYLSVLFWEIDLFGNIKIRVNSTKLQTI